MIDRNRLRKYIGYKIAENGKYFSSLSDSKYLSIIYRILVNEKLNLKNPKSYTEKLQWLKIYDHKRIYNTMVDKYEVRNYIKKTIGEEYLIPLIDVYDNVEDINWESLPKEFVLKATHTSGNVIICKDKNNLNKSETIKELNKWLKRDYYSYFREWPYKDLKPKIVCEKFLSEIGDVPVDYKIMCFSGEPEIIQVHRGRFEEHTIEYYDKYWNKLDIYSEGYKKCDYISEKPKELHKLLMIARKLSANLPQSRIDLYLVNGNVYFSEITFFDGAGFDKFYPEEFNNYLGDLINIEEIKYAEN